MSSSPSQSGALEKFLEKVLEQQAKPDVEFNSASLRTLAEKYGLDSEAYDKLVSEAQEHRTRGLLFFEHGNWDDAISELDQAYVILPHDAELGFVLGKAYTRQFNKAKINSDRVFAEKFFRQCIKRDPAHAEAVRELTDLEKFADELAAAPSRFKPVLIVLAVLLFVGVVYTLGQLLGGFSVAKDKESSTPKEKPPQAETVKPAPSVKPQTGPVAIPTEFPLADAGDEFTFDARSSVLTRYDGKYGYQLLGTILTGPVTIGGMRAKLELLGDDEKVFAEHEFDILPSHRSATVAGDSIPFRVLIFKEEPAPEIVEARLTMLLFDRSPFLGEVEAGKPLELTQEKVKLPPNYGFTIRERNVLLSKGSLGDEGKALLKLILTVENTGKRQIEQMKFQASVTGQDGETIPLGYNSISKHFSNRIAPGEFTAVSKIQPPMLPGERRVIEASIYMPDAAPEDIEGYQLELLLIE